MQTLNCEQLRTTQLGKWKQRSPWLPSKFQLRFFSFCSILRFYGCPVPLFSASGCFSVFGSLGCPGSWLLNSQEHFVKKCKVFPHFKRKGTGRRKLFISDFQIQVFARAFSIRILKPVANMNFEAAMSKVIVTSSSLDFVSLAGEQRTLNWLHTQSLFSLAKRGPFLEHQGFAFSAGALPRPHLNRHNKIRARGLKRRRFQAICQLSRAARLGLLTCCRSNDSLAAPAPPRPKNPTDSTRLLRLLLRVI